jgi:hypothetical protein
MECLTILVELVVFRLVDISSIASRRYLVNPILDPVLALFAFFVDLWRAVMRCVVKTVVEFIFSLFITVKIRTGRTPAGDQRFVIRLVFSPLDDDLTLVLPTVTVDNIAASLSPSNSSSSSSIPGNRRNGAPSTPDKDTASASPSTLPAPSSTAAGR